MGLVEIRRLSECTIEEAVKAWNDGFEGYYFDATTTPDQFIKRMAIEELSPELSIVAFKGNEPIGIVENGVRDLNGSKIGWNGGTGVAAKYRGTGVGKLLIEAALSVLKEAGVKLATLEAISENHKAISLYEKMGYVQVDELEHLSLKGPAPQPFHLTSGGNYTVERAPTVRAGKIPFYKASNPWQTHWQNAKDSEAVIVRDLAGEPAGYAYFKKVFNAEGDHITTVLYQCEAAPGHPDAVNLLKVMAAHVFGDLQDDINRVVPNLPKGASALTGVMLKSLGFTPMVQQVYMTKEL
ncbi:GNAT family N-acetyltransferase [Paenibacillus caui]|uniref:GNAT family N-acetyltransferase n=1 Tax=Paenibacillus caui TaxID=2873927 RepID=UPI001F2FD5C5|nr:GNAT family N-acetyltransferase [Paenibacillus caui]